MDATGGAQSSGDDLTAQPEMHVVSSGEGALSHGRFVPGTVIGKRFRIVSLLGRGGMGEVYRAEDLRLEQAVALKFLPEAWSEDPGRLSRLLREVRLAREITHPSVCRVHDFFDLDGHRFVSMEYVDGENLAILLQRIGRLPQPKALEIAHQILAGLGAAHLRGILHRDLKPENVMIDGRGHAHLMDFGIAAWRQKSHEADDCEGVIGTPAYLAPELLQGQMPSEQSDLYAMGIVLFEMFTGEKPFKAPDFHRLFKKHLDEPVPSPRSLVADLDPAVDSMILQCLEKNPARRPASARAVALGLPGGNPLANALAAGETPAPEVVAEAGNRDGASFRWLLFHLFGFLALLALFAGLSGKATLLGWLPSAKSVAVLEDRAEAVTQASGWPQKPCSARYAYHVNPLHLYQLAHRGAGRPDWAALDQGDSPLLFHYFRTTNEGRPINWTPSDLDQVVLDHRGNLLELARSPWQPEGSGSGEDANREPDWPTLFRLAGLKEQDFVLENPVSSGSPDPQRIWSRRSGAPGEPQRITAQVVQGQLLTFRVGAYLRTPAGEDRGMLRFLSWGSHVRMAAYVLAILIAMFLARTHLRGGKADRKGALRLAWSIGLAQLVCNLLVGGDYSFRSDPIPAISNLIGEPVVDGFLAWVIYLAVEPSLRRQWPLSLVSWVRLLAGRWKDPLVGQDVLAGMGVGALAAVLVAALRLIPFPHGMLNQFPLYPWPDSLSSISAMLGVMVRTWVQSVGVGLAILFGVVMLWRLTRSRWVALILVYLIVLIPFSIMSGASIPVFLLVHGFILVLPMHLLKRSGLLAFVMFYFTLMNLSWVVGTSHWDSWMGTHSLVALGVLGAMGLAAFRLAWGSRSWIQPEG